MHEAGKGHDDITRRTALRRGAGVAVAGAAFTVASAQVSSAVAADADADADAGVRGDRAPEASRSGVGHLPRSVGGIRIPGSRLAREAAEFAREASSETLFNHVMRSYLFGCALLDRRGVPYDRELAFVAAVLHDLGLVEAHRTPAERFEVDGADAARRFLVERRVPAERVDVVWDAIALHTSTGIATRKRPEIAMVSLGSGLDFSGNDLQQIPSGTREEILAAFPRKGFKQDALSSILSLCRTKPLSTLMHPFAEVGRRHIPGFPVPTVEDLLLGAPFAD